MGTFRARACWPQVILLGRNQESGPQGERSSEKERHFQGAEPDVQATGRQMGCRKRAERAGSDVQSLPSAEKDLACGAGHSGNIKAVFTEAHIRF